MDDKKIQEKLKNLVNHSQKISDVMTKINGRIEKWAEKKQFLHETLSQIAEEINKSGIENIKLETVESKRSVGLQLKPITSSGDVKTTIHGGHLNFTPTFHFRISITLLEPYIGSSGEEKPQYLRDYDVEELSTDVAFKEVENFMDHLKHFFERGASF